MIFGFEIITKTPDDVSSYEFLVRQFKTNVERGKWLRQGNMKPYDYPVLYLKRHNKIATYHPICEAAKNIGAWPCIVRAADVNWCRVVCGMMAFKGNFTGN